MLAEGKKSPNEAAGPSERTTTTVERSWGWEWLWEPKELGKAVTQRRHLRGATRGGMDSLSWASAHAHTHVRAQIETETHRKKQRQADKETVGK